MVFYALATLPLVQHLRIAKITIRHLWYAHDSSGAGRLQALQHCLDNIEETGEAYGYQVNVSDTLLLVRPELLDSANSIFTGSGIAVVADGACYLGAAIGTKDFISTYTMDKV